MRGDQIIATQLLMAQAVSAMSEHLLASTGLQLTPVLFADLPIPPAKGMLACVTDSTSFVPSAIVVGGGAFSVLCWHNGTNWTVVGA